MECFIAINAQRNMIGPKDLAGQGGRVRCAVVMPHATMFRQALCLIGKKKLDRKNNKLCIGARQNG
jgi:hypothetical protein